MSVVHGNEISECLSLRNESKKEIDCDDNENKYLKNLPYIASFLQNFSTGKKLEEWLVEMEPVRKESASDSMIISAKTNVKNKYRCKNVQDIKVILKFQILKKDIPLEYERRVYDCIISNFYSMPFFTFPVAINSAWYIDRERKFVATEDCGKVTLSDFFSMPSENISDNNIYIYDKYKAILQMICALNFMAEKDLMHGDMHFNNIFYTEYSHFTNKENDFFFFDVYAKKVVDSENENTLTCNRMIKIFDWDFAYNENYTVPVTDIVKKLKGIPIKKIYDKIAFLRRLQFYNILEDVLPENIDSLKLKIFLNCSIKFNRMQYTCIKIKKDDECNEIDEKELGYIEEWINLTLEAIYENICLKLSVPSHKASAKLSVPSHKASALNACLIM